MIALGIDIGTSSVKVLALDSDGHVVAIASAAYPLQHDTYSGSFEVDPEDWWSATCQATRTCLAEGSIDAHEIAAIGLSGNMSSVVLVDHRGKAIRPAMLLADARGSEEVQKIPAALREEIQNTTHNDPTNTAFALSKLLWLNKHAHEDIKRADKWLAAKDFIRLRLTGVAGAEPTDAGNWLLIDPQIPIWQCSWIDKLQLPIRLFPRLHKATDVVGKITREAAEEIGLLEGTAVVAGVADMTSAAIGAGTLQRGDLAVSLGTSTTIIAPLGDTPFPTVWQDKMTYHPFPYPLGNYALGSLLTGGLALNWLGSLGTITPMSQEIISPEALPPLVFLPYLLGTGTPLFDNRVRGTMLGISPQTRLYDIMVALFEAIAFDIRTVIELLSGTTIDCVRVSSGGANIDTWLQIIADVTGVLVEVVAEKEVSAIGAAVIAASGSGICGRLLDTVKQVVRVRQTYLPRKQFAELWDKRYLRYNKALQLVRAYYH